MLAIHAAPLHQEIDRFLVGRDDAGEAANLRRHVGHGGALVHAELFDGLARVLHHFGQRLAAAHVVEAENLQNEIFRRDVGMLLAANDDLHRLRHLHPNIFRDPRIENIGGANAKGHAADRAHVRSVRVRADIQLSRQRIALQHDGVADALRSFAVFQFAMQLDSLLRGEILLLELELGGQIEQAQFLFLLRNHFIEKGQVIAEKQNARGIVHLRIFANIALEENRRHRRNVLVAEAQVGPGETGIARFDRRQRRRSPLLVHHVAGKDFLAPGHGTPGRLDRRQETFSPASAPH